MKTTRITHLLWIALLLMLAACSQPAKPQTEALVNPKVAALSTGWNIQTIDGSAGAIAGQDSQMVLDSNGNPIIAYRYFSGGVGQLRVARCGNATCSSGNTINTVATGTSGSFISMVLDSSGKPVIAFNDNTNPTVRLLRCGDAACSSGNTIKAIDNGSVGWHLSLVLDSNGSPVISYVDFGNAWLKVTHCSDAVCSSASTNVAATLADKNVGGSTSMVLDSSGNPVISFQNVPSSGPADLKLVHCGDANCSSGNVVQTIEAGGFVGGYNSLKLDASGNPVISYFDRNNGDLKLAHCADANCSAGTSIQQVDAPPSTNVGSGTSLVLSNGKPVISYYDLTNLSLKLARCGDANCSSGNTIQTVGPAIYQGNTSSLKLDSAGNPVVSFTGGTFGAFTLNLARAVVISCAVGSYDNGSSCVPADPGYFVDTAGATVQTPCPVGYYQPSSGAISCNKADAGNFVDKTAQIVQTPCAIGSYQPSTGSSSCLLADKGNFVDKTGQATQTPCAVGTYQDATGQSSCKPAAAGNFVATAGAQTQTPCPVGSFQPNTGATNCNPALPGNFVAIAGASAQTPCLAGSFQSASGQTSCTLASPGSFVATSGQISQIPCPAGTYQPNTGASSCIQASAGFYVPTAGATAQIQCPSGTTSVAGATACTPITTIFSFTGFFGLSNPPVLNNAKAGSELELKFSLGGKKGLGVVSSLTQVQINCSTLAPIGSPASMGKDLEFEEGKYQLEVKTLKNWSGTCRQIAVNLSDGTVHPVNFNFR